MKKLWTFEFTPAIGICSDFFATNSAAFVQGFRNYSIVVACCLYWDSSLFTRAQYRSIGRNSAQLGVWVKDGTVAMWVIEVEWSSELTRTNDEIIAADLDVGHRHPKGIVLKCCECPIREIWWSHNEKTSFSSFEMGNWPSEDIRRRCAQN